MNTPKDKNLLAQQWSVEEGGCHIDMLCPHCRKAIVGTYLPSFACPHCNSLIITYDDNKVGIFEGEEDTCPECGHVFRRVENRMLETSIIKTARKVEDFVLGLDRVFSKL